MAALKSSCGTCPCGATLVQSSCDKIRRILTLTYPYTWEQAKGLKVFDSANNNITSDILYSWSTDKVCWTSWTTYAQYKKSCSKLSTDYFLRILFSGRLGGINISGTAPEYTICLDNTNIFLTDFCSLNSTYSIYDGLDCALLLQQQLADAVICMFGIPVYYIKVNPDEKTEDFTFKEYVLHEAAAIKQIKLMLQDGALPSSNPQLTSLDFAWETSWDTEISKTQFARAFGADAFPKQRDLIYVPLLKRMYEVNAAYDEKNEGLLWRSTTWKLQLVKYNEKSNVDTTAFDAIIDNWIINTYHNVIGCPEMNEQERESGAGLLEMPRTANNNLYNIAISDAIRKEYTKDYLDVVDKTVCHRNNVVCRNSYSFKYPESKVTYQKTACGNAGTVILEIETPDNNISADPGAYTIMTTGNVSLEAVLNENNTLSLKFGNIVSDSLDISSNYIVNLVWNTDLNIMEMHIYAYVHEDIPEWKRKSFHWWFDFENPYFESSSVSTDNMIMAGGAPYDPGISLSGYPLRGIGNFKYYLRALSDEDQIKESVKYVTDHPACLVCDSVRPFYDSGRGYPVK